MLNQTAAARREGSTNRETAYARRNFLAGAIAALHAAIGGTLAFVLGGSVLSPSFAVRREKWLAAGTLSELAENEPVPVAVRVVRADGYTQVVDRHVVFLVRTGEADVYALSSVCTHLGCRVSWNAADKELRCPCHGGAFDRHGTVKAGPPPVPLARLATRIDGGRILVQLG
jgi:succinate dehydrogenase / fumarate reductase, iron-sulfur subunit